MEHSIDLKYLSQITFNDPSLMNEMIQEWITDTETRIQEFESTFHIEDSKKRFKMIHTLKTNYFMVGCSTMIKECENYLNSNFSDEDSLFILVRLKESLQQVKNLVLKYMST